MKPSELISELKFWREQPKRARWWSAIVCLLLGAGVVLVSVVNAFVSEKVRQSVAPVNSATPGAMSARLAEAAAPGVDAAWAKAPAANANRSQPAPGASSRPGPGVAPSSEANIGKFGASQVVPATRLQEQNRESAAIRQNVETGPVSAASSSKVRVAKVKTGARANVDQK